MRGERRKEYKLEIKLSIQEYDVTYTDYQGEILDPAHVQTDEIGDLYIANEDGDRFPVRRREEWVNNGRLSVEDSRVLGVRDFMGLMRVLAKMHEAIEEIS